MLIDDDYEIIDEDLDYVLLFDKEENKPEQKNGSGCCVVMFALFSSASYGIIALSKFFI